MSSAKDSPETSQKLLTTVAWLPFPAVCLHRITVSIFDSPLMSFRAKWSADPESRSSTANLFHNLMQDTTQRSVWEQAL